MPCPGKIFANPSSVKAFVFVGSECCADVGFVGFISGANGGVFREGRASDERFHHEELYSSDALQPSAGDVPRFTCPQERLSYTALEYLESVWQGGVSA